MILEEIIPIKNILSVKIETDSNGRELYKGFIKLRNKTLEYFESRTLKSLIHKIESSPFLTSKQITKLNVVVHKLQKERELNILPDGRIK